MNITEIETRLSAIKAELEKPDADVEKLNTEVDQLLEERTKLRNAEETRKRALDNIAGATTVQVRASGVQVNAQADDEAERPDPYAAEEYRSAYMSRLMGKELTNVQRRAMATVDNPSVIPTQTANTIMERFKAQSSLLNDITMFNIPGNLTVNVEDEIHDAEMHEENAAITPGVDTVKPVTLNGYEIVRLIGLSAKLEYMSIPAFESWLVDNMADKLRDKITSLIISGTGASQPKGFTNSITWTAGGDNANAVQWAGSALAAGDIMKAISILPSVYDSAAKWRMSKRTFWANVYAIRDDSKSPMVRESGGKFYLGGYQVEMDDKMPHGEIYLGDWKKIIANMPQSITIKRSEEAGFLTNTTYYRGTAIFDSAVAIPEAFVKIAQTIA